MKFAKLTTLASILFFANIVFAQNEIGIPQIKNFAPSNYKWESQNYSIVQDANSIIYIGNASGVMEYDNEKWNIVNVQGVPLLAADDKGNVYYGGYNTFGKITHKNGSLVAEEFDTGNDTAFGQIQKIVAIDDGIYFATSEKLFHYTNNKVQPIINVSPLDIFKVYDKLYIKTQRHGIDILRNGKIDTDKFCATVDSIEVIDIIPIEKDHSIVVEKHNNNLYEYQNGKIERFYTEADHYIFNNTYNTSKLFRDKYIIIGTEHGGVITIDLSGKLLYIINTSNGLRDNKISDIYIDHQSKTWLSTNNGLSLLETDSELSFFDNSFGINGTVVSMLRFNETLYAGTTNGIYYYDKMGVRSKFRPIRNMRSLCWQLTEFDSTLFAVTREGIFEITNVNEAKPVLKGVYQTMKHLTTIQDSLVLAIGDNKGVLLAKIKNGSIDTIGHLAEIKCKVRTIAEDKDGDLWLGTDSDGLFKVDFDSLHSTNSKVTKIQGQGLPQKYDWIDVYSLSNYTVLFSTSKGLFCYDNTKHNFYNYTINQNAIHKETAFYTPIIEGSNKDIWYSCAYGGRYGREVGVMKYDSTTNEYTRYCQKFAQMSESVIEVIYPENDSVVWFGTTDALIKFDRHLVKDIDTTFNCLIRRISIGNDSLIAFENTSTEIKLRYKDKKIRFEFAGLSFNTFGDTEYQTMLEGFDDDWGEWSSDAFKEYTSLKEGEYTFKVRARNGYGVVSNVQEMEFYVSPPYYRTLVAYILYVLAVVAICFMVFAIWNLYESKEKAALERLVEIRTNELAMQKEQTEQLVKKLLPQNTADEIKRTGSVKSRKYEMVTVLFADIEGFTKIASQTNPEELIKYLNEIFTIFDKIISKYNIEKIKTIGDAYMCTGGMPNRDGVNPVDVVLAGLEMQQAMRKLNDAHELKLNMRVGIHTGPVVAGVVGEQKIEYDIWGDTVNIASRMESHGMIGRVNISDETYHKIKDFFSCESRGIMEVKHKGEMEMYFVNGILPQLSENGDGITPNHDFIIKEQNLNYLVIQEEMLDQLQRDLPRNLYYHNLKHTTDVLYVVADLANKEGVSEEDLLLLKCAALFHDSGFMVSYDNNEEIGAKLAAETLLKYKFTTEQINVVKRLIMATKVPQRPKDLLEQIICDADLNYLGRLDFIPISQNLFRELFERNKIDTIEQWNKMQYRFITSHSYFTETARRNGAAGKEQVIKELAELI